MPFGEEIAIVRLEHIGRAAVVVHVQRDITVQILRLCTIILPTGQEDTRVQVFVQTQQQMVQEKRQKVTVCV